MSEVKMLYWVQTGPKEYTARDNTRQFFSIKYVVSGDEDDTYQGTFEQWWREVGKENDQYTHLGLEDVGIKGRYSLPDLLQKLEAFHRFQAWPALCDLTSQYIRDNESNADSG